MTRRIPSFVAVLTVTAAAAGCGQSQSAEKHATKPKCALTATGQKVCDEDLVAYCHGFADMSDPATVHACARVHAVGRSVRGTVGP